MDCANLNKHEKSLVQELLTDFIRECEHEAIRTKAILECPEYWEWLDTDERKLKRDLRSTKRQREVAKRALDKLEE